jgi:hypothetical protein
MSEVFGSLCGQTRAVTRWVFPKTCGRRISHESRIRLQLNIMKIRPSRQRLFSIIRRPIKGGESTSKPFEAWVGIAFVGHRRDLTPWCRKKNNNSEFLDKFDFRAYSDCIASFPALCKAGHKTRLIRYKFMANHIDPPDDREEKIRSPSRIDQWRKRHDKGGRYG